MQSVLRSLPILLVKLISDQGGDSNKSAWAPEVSADGSTVVFNSPADSNMVSGITDFIQSQDSVFAYNMAGNTVSLVSAKAPGVFTVDSDVDADTDDLGIPASLSDNGRYLAFRSDANDLFGSLLYGPSSVFAEDVQKGVPIVVATGGFYAEAWNGEPVISGDGSTVAFQSSQQLTSNDVSGGKQIFTATNWQTGNPTFTLVSVDSAGTDAGNADSENPSISDNGQVIAFDSGANNLVNNDTTGSGSQIFVRNLGTNTTTLASANSSGTGGGNNESDTQVVSADGSTVIFNSSATDLVSGVSVPPPPYYGPENVYAYLSNTSGPIITSNPSSQTVTVGQTATFTASASGNPMPSVQWQVSTDDGKTFTNISGTTSTTLTLSNVQASQSGEEYQAVFTSSSGTTATSAATLTVTAAVAPIISGNPSSQTVTAGQTMTFTAAASGSPTPTVQWQVSSDGGKTFSNISGAASTTLTLNNVNTVMSGDEYQAVFTNSAGSATTSAATLTVVIVAPPPPAPPPPPSSPPPPPALNPPPLLAFFDSLLGGTETVNSNGTETITDSFFGIPLLVSTFDSSGNLMSVDLFGFDVTFLFLLL